MSIPDSYTLGLTLLTSLKEVMPYGTYNPLLGFG
jgi:hypothetical protein